MSDSQRAELANAEYLRGIAIQALAAAGEKDRTTCRVCGGGEPHMFVGGLSTCHACRDARYAR